MSFGGLYIATSGLYANKKALDTVSHNVANANNPDYVRQRTIHAERSYLGVGTQYKIGTGVDVQQIGQIRDEFLDADYRRKLSTFGYYEAKSEVLEEMEYVFREIKTPDMLASGALQDIMDDFWDGWSELYKDPESLTIRGVLHERGVAFATTTKHIYTQLENMQENLNKEMLNKAKEVNGLLYDINKLNESIKVQETEGPHIKSNDLRDIREAKIDRLVELIPIHYYENNQSEMVISLNGRSLVNGDYFNPIEIRMNSKGHGEIYYSDTGDKIELANGGELSGYIHGRDTEVVEYMDRLNILVKTLAEKINEIHKGGWGLVAESTGNDFFNFDEANPAATIIVNPELNDYNKIAVSKSHYTDDSGKEIGIKGDGEIIKDILALREDLLFDKYNSEDSTKPLEEKSLNIDGFYRDLIMSLGIKREEAREIAYSQELLMKQIDERRQEVSAVSMDEEMTNMLKYQHSYIANSRVINAVDEMIDIIINLIR